MSGDKSIFHGIKAGFLFIGAVIGAGFASGREILVFFGNSDIFFVYVCIFCCLLFALIAILFMTRAKRKNMYTLQDLSKQTFKAGGGVFNVFIIFCQIIIVGAMLAAIDSLFKEVLGVQFDFPLFSVFSLILACIVLSFGINGIMEVNTVLVPLILVFMVLIVIFAKKPDDVVLAKDVLAQGSIFKSAMSAVLYIGMNMLLTVNVLISPCKTLGKKQIYIGAILGAVVISLMIFVIGTTLLNSSEFVVSENMPLLYLTNEMPGIFRLICACVILCAIFTTLTASMFPVVQYTKTFVKNKYLNIVIVSLVGFIISRFGFSSIVGILYPIMGVLGIVFVISFFIFTRDKKTYKNDRNSRMKKTP